MVKFIFSQYREGKGDVSRTRLIDRLQLFLPPNVMLPPRRLRSLLKQAVEYQADHCSCHDVAWRTDLDNVSLLTDHDCGTDNVMYLMHAYIVLFLKIILILCYYPFEYSSLCKQYRY